MKWLAIMLAGMLCMTGCNNGEPGEMNMERSTIYISAPDKGEMPDSGSEIPMLPQSSSIMAESKVPVSSAETPVESKAPSSAPPIHVETSSSEVVLTPSESAPSKVESQSSSPSNTAVASSDEIRAVWISYLDFYTLARDKTEAEFTANIKKAFREYVDYGLNTLFVQVRPFGDALYESDLVPYSHTLNSNRKEGQDPGYDLLEIMVNEAKALGMTIEAWLNPYRIRNSNTNVGLSNDNPAKKMLNDGSRSVIEYDGVISFNPASTKAQEHIVAVVEEIIQNYDVDGIHFDDYFYPTTAKAFDDEDYEDYRSSGGKLSLEEWRRNNVSALIKKVYQAIKSHDGNLVFGISPQAKMENNYHGQFIDVEMMIEKGGYMDYVCPQIYYGFENETMPYESTLALWNEMVNGTKVDLYIGLGPYKSGLEDSWAGSGKREWMEHTDITQRMVQSARDASEYDGFAIFRSEIFFHPTGDQRGYINEERSNLRKILD